MRRTATALANTPSPRKDLAFEVAGETLSLQACGALWWKASSVLVVSDLHLEKGSAYAAGGQMLPPYDTRATLQRIAALVDELEPTTVISLGDSFHDRGARPRMAADDVALMRRLTSAADWVWIEGNHDPKPPEDLGGRMASDLRMGALVFRHEPLAGLSRGEIAGHLHPCARVAGKMRSVRSRCFVSDGERLVMPAYGALTGGLNILDKAFGAIFPRGAIAGVLGRDGVYAAMGARLVRDGY
ncbi:MAG TPA: ligase-associated DNA damage response endonuclease PdeM [Hyphomonadaceae bacterium]|jgi:DNA ligase-associated metallophosphoesterase|nr:ligase-associated DNA damage response endonuclease PdeM [Hyphomonadaceae bacterium]